MPLHNPTSNKRILDDCKKDVFIIIELIKGYNFSKIFTKAIQEWINVDGERGPKRMNIIYKQYKASMIERV